MKKEKKIKEKLAEKGEELKKVKKHSRKSLITKGRSGIKKSKAR